MRRGMKEIGCAVVVGRRQRKKRREDEVEEKEKEGEVGNGEGWERREEELE